MPVIDVIALVLGLGIALVTAVLAAGVADSPDDSMRWEGGVAVGFGAIIGLGPFWLAQLILTVIATFSDGGVSPGWLWAWFFAAPVIGMSPPAIAVVRVLKRLRGRSR